MHTIVTVAATAFALAVSAAHAQQLQPRSPPPDFDKVTIKTTEIGGRIFLLQGIGGNVTVALADDGVIMIDSAFAPLHDKIKAAVTALTPQPVRFLIDTHFHNDHTGGNEAFARDGATAVAHENVKTRLASGSKNTMVGTVEPPAPELALPKQTYRDTMVVHLQGRSAELRHIPNAHTDGDSTVYFADANVLVSGDVVFFGRYPNIDYDYGGSIDGMIRGTDELLKVVNDATKIVPGHGPAGTKAMMQDYRRLLMDARDRIASLKAAGKTEDEVVAAKPLADYDARFGADPRAIFVRVVYRSL